MGPGRSSTHYERSMMNTPTPVPQITRRSFIVCAAGLCSTLLIPRTASASDSQVGKIDDAYERLSESDLASPDAYYAAVDKLGVGWDHYKSSIVGTSVLAAHYETYAEAEASLAPQTRGVITKLLQIVVKVAKKIIGYITAKVDVGSMIVTEIVSSSANYLVKQAANYFLNRRYQATYTLPCTVYPPHSGEYIRCINA